MRGEKTRKRVYGLPGTFNWTYSLGFQTELLPRKQQRKKHLHIFAGHEFCAQHKKKKKKKKDDREGKEGL